MFIKSRKWKIILILFLLISIYFINFFMVQASADEMHDAIFEDNWVRVLQIILKKPSIVNQRDNFGFMPLHTATYFGNYNIVRLLVFAGADVNARNTNGSTPIFLAAAQGFRAHEIILEFLISKGADVNAKDNDGDGPLKPAFIFKKTRMIHLLIRKGADVKTVAIDGSNYLFCSPDRKTAEFLILNGVQVRAKDNRGLTPLHLTDNKDTAKLFISEGADVNAKDNNGRTPLYYAVEYSREDLVDALVESGADINIKDTDGETPLSRARHNGHLDLIDYLLAHGAKDDKDK